MSETTKKAWSRTVGIHGGEHLHLAAKFNINEDGFQLAKKRYRLNVVRELELRDLIVEQRTCDGLNYLPYCE